QLAAPALSGLDPGDRVRDGARAAGDGDEGTAPAHPVLDPIGDFLPECAAAQVGEDDHVVGLEPYSADPVERDGVEGDPESVFEEEPVRAERVRRDAVAGHDGDPGHLEAIRVVAPEVAPLAGEPRPDGGGDEVEAARLDETAELRVPGSWEEDGPGRPLAS